MPHRGPASYGMCFLPWTATKALFPFQPCFSVWLSQALSICFFSLSGLVYPIGQRDNYKDFYGAMSSSGLGIEVFLEQGIVQGAIAL